MSRRPFSMTLVLVLVLLPAAGLTFASDWPTYRHDIARSGCTSDALEPPLALRWVYVASHQPRPGWSAPARRPREGFTLRPRVNFDDAFQVAVSDGRVYFGSSADDTLRAISVETGEEIWSFCTGGPIRLAPTAWRDRIFVGSDDGLVYCLDMDTGAVVWKQRGGPRDERLLGSGRMISRWPIRTGVLVDGEVACFGAGIFPHENVYLLAVRAEDGKILWRNDTISEAQAYRSDFSPQGYLLAAETRLFVPSGRGLPVGFDKSTGQMAFNRSYGWRGEEAGGLIGGTYALLADDQLYTGTQDHLLALNQETGRTGFAWFPGRRLTVSENTAYLATGRELLSLDRLAYAEASRRRNSLEYRTKQLQSQVSQATGEKRQQVAQQLERTKTELAQHNRDKTEPAIRWRTACACDAELIVSDNMVVAGGQNEVKAFARADGRLAWEAKVEGRASGLAVADGRLYVSTDLGRIYCFATNEPDEDGAQVVRQVRSPVVAPYPEDAWTPVYKAAAESIIMETGVTRGYCLVLGAEQGRLALELARQTDLHVIGVEPDPSKVRAARSALEAAGLYGERVVIDQGDLSSLPYSNYFADLVVSDSLLLTGDIPGDPSRIARHVKPCGGAVCLGAPASAPRRDKSVSADALNRWMDRLGLGACRMSKTNGLWATLRRGPLPGAGRWTHQYANAGNTACSDDLRLGGPLGLLWFGEPGPAPMVNRHDAAAAPLAVNGRLFIQGENVVMAYDSYNGVLLWKRDVPGAMRTRLKRSECGNLAASDDCFFVAAGDKCLQLDAETGQTRNTYVIPSDDGAESGRWGFLACEDGVLYGSRLKQTGVSDKVFAIDLPSGEVLWERAGTNIVNLTIAVGDGWMFFVDSSLSPEQRAEFLRQDKTELRRLQGEAAKRAEEAAKRTDVRKATALDARTGGVLWETPVDVTDCSVIGIGGGELSAMYQDGVLVLCGANANGHYWRQFLSGEFSQRRLVALSARTGRTLWACDANYRHRPLIVGDAVFAEPWAYDVNTGTQKTRAHPVSGEETPWQFLRPGHHCGAISACPQMLMMRSGFTAYYDLRDDSGIRHFAGQRPGCWINMIAADGLALVPEASAGCVCLFPITCSLALEPRVDHERWSIYSASTPKAPVRHLAVNLGAPGDRRDVEGTLWLAYPRPSLPSDRAAMGLSLPIQVELRDGGGYAYDSSESGVAELAGESWLFTSGVKGLKRCTIPLRGAGAGPAKYVVRLYFASPPDQTPREDGLDIKLQGNRVGEDAEGNRHVTEGNGRYFLEFSDVLVQETLEVEFVPRDDTETSVAGGPLVCALEMLCVPTDVAAAK